MIPELLENLTGQWSDNLYSAGLILKKPLTALQAGGARGKDRKVNLLIFNGSQPYPLLILKLARSQNYQNRLRQEFQALTEVSNIPALKGTIPKAIGMFQVDSHLIVAETFLPGTPLSILLRRRERVKPDQIREDIFSAQRWLRGLQISTHSGSSFLGVEAALQRGFQQLKNELPQDFADEIMALGDCFHGLQFPCVGSHGDFWPGNFLHADSGPSVIDWESYKRRHPPFRDAFSFITTYARTFPWKGWKWPTKAEAFNKAFLQKNWFSEMLQDYFEKFMTDLSLPPECSHFLFSMFLLDLAAEERTNRIKEGQWFTFLMSYAEQRKNSILKRL